jgi:prepilin-type N-terminal cleavage/methylation domain-containing protein
MTISGKGFTLLELIIVGVVISIVLTTSIPLIRTLFFSDPLRKSTRLVTAFMEESRERALESENGVALVVDLSNGRMAIIPQPVDNADENIDASDYLGIVIPPAVSIVSVWSHGSGRTVDGTAPIYINRRGMVEPFMIDLRQGARIMRVKGMPFDDSVEVLDQKSFSSAPAAVLSATTR